MLQIASVQGYEFLAQVIASLTGKSERDVLEVLSKYLDRQHNLIVEIGEEIVGSTTISRFRFTNIFYQEHIYHNMGSGVRRIRHREVAEALEELYKEDLGQVTIFLAKHYERANKPRKASEYLVMLGKQQLANRQIDEGISTLERALSLARNSGYVNGIIDSLRYLGMEFIGDVKHEDAEALLEEAIRLAREHKQLAALSYSLRGLGRIRRSQERNSEAMYHYMEGLNVAYQIEDMGLAGACLTNIGVLASAEERYNDAIYFFLERLKIAEETGDDDGKIISWLNLGDAYRNIGQLETSRIYLEKGLELVSTREDWLRECGVKIALAYLEVSAGNLKTAAHLLLETLDVATSKKHDRRRAESLICAADVLVTTGYLEIAAKVIGHFDEAPIARPERSRIKNNMSQAGSSEAISLAMQMGKNLELGQIQSEVEKHLYQVND